MRITYNFYERCTKLPADQLAKATALKVTLYGSLSATGKGHGTERATLAGIIGKEPATINPLFLDEIAANPDKTYPVTLGPSTFNVSLKDVIYGAHKGRLPASQHDDLPAAGRRPGALRTGVLLGGRRLHRVEGIRGARRRASRSIPYATMEQLQAHAVKNKLTIAQIAMANEVSVSGKTEAEINAFLDKISTAMVNIVKSGLAAPVTTLPGPIKLKTKAGEVYKRAMDEKYAGQRGVGIVAAYALAGSEENARGHLVVTAPTGGSAGVMPALVYALGEGGRKLPQEKIRDGLLAAAVIGYLVKHHATLAGAEGGCQAEIGTASAMGAALIAQANDFDHQVIANSAESSLEHHLGLTCDPVAGYVQIPCIERCAYGAVKAWTGFLIASNEIPADRRVDFDTTVSAWRSRPRR